MTIFKKNYLSIPLIVVMMGGLSQNSTAIANTNNAPSQGSLVISPTPQSVKQTGEGFLINGEVGLIIGDKTDQYAVKVVKDILKSIDIENIKDIKAEEKDINTPVKIWIGGPSENPKSSEILGLLNAEGPDNLKSEGYVLASGIDSSGSKNIVLAGKGNRGTFYAARTLRQIIGSKSETPWIPGVEIRDYPVMPLRGAIEGFYGPPWSHKNRLDQVEFYGSQKMNTYIYAPKDDPYHRDKWREPYPADKLEMLHELVTKCRENHVDFNFAISPGTSIRFSNDEDFKALVNKAQAMWDIGVKTFSILLDDIDYNLRDPQDIAMFGKDPNPPAAAQAYLLNRFQREFIETHQGANPLVTVPTEYYTANHTPYLDRMAILTDPKVVFMWTGTAVVPATITAKEAKSIKEVLKHDILIWYNYPVNDYCRNQLLMGPMVGLDPELCNNGITGIISNPMNEAEASKIPVFTIGDYNWNPESYNSEDSWIRAIRDLGPNAVHPLYVFCDNARSSILTNKESTDVKPIADEFLINYKNKDIESLENTGKKLIKEFEKIKDAPGDIRSKLKNSGFISETDKYLTKLELLGESGISTVNMMLALAKDDIQTAWKYRLEAGKSYNRAKSINLIIASRVIQPFITGGIGEYDKAIIKNKYKTFSTLNTYNDYTPDKMLDGNDSTFYWTSSAAHKDDYIGIDLGEIKDIYNIHILMGSQNNSTDYMRNAVLEYSTDNNTWTSLTEPQSSREILINNIKINARYVRLRCVQDYGTWWIQVREFFINTTPLTPSSAISSLPTYSSYNPERMLDGNTSTFYWTSREARANDYIGVDLGEVKDVKNINILMGSPGGDLDFIGNGVVEYSADNNTWTALTDTLNQREIALNNLSIKARYIRYRCVKEYGPYWVKVREFSVNRTDGDIAISGKPEGEEGFALTNILDQKLDTVYRASISPKAGDSILLTLPTDKEIEKIIILQDPDVISNAEIEVNNSSSNPEKLGILSAGYNSFNVSKQVNQISLKWNENNLKPVIYEVIIQYKSNSNS